MYIVTRSGTYGEKPPVKTKSYQKAKELLLKFTAENIRQEYSWSLPYNLENNTDDKRLIDWARARFAGIYQDDFILEDNYSYIFDGGDEMEEVHIYNLDELKDEEGD